MNSILRSALLVLFVSMAGLSAAQQWCPPGAEWRYPYTTQLHPQQGTLRYTYEGDSLFQGEVCQHLVSHAYFPDLTQWGPWHSFTTTAPGVIRFWNTLVSQFDTLVNFDAVPGMGWSFNGFQSQNYFITVQDTGTRVIDGIPLRYMVITSEPPWLGLAPDTVHERIGALDLLNFEPWSNWFMESPTSDGLGCYRDDEMEYQRPLPWGLEIACDISLSVAAHLNELVTELQVHPNPGEDRLWISSSTVVNQHRLMVHDVLGRPMGEWAMNVRGMELNTATWTPGLYLLELVDGHSTRATAKWIKQ